MQARSRSRGGAAEFTRRLLHIHKDTRHGSVEEDDDLIKEAILAERWEELFNKNITLGAQTLMFVDICWLMVQLFALYMSVRASKTSAKAVSTNVFVAMEVLEFIFLVGAIPALRFVAKNPSPKLYFPILLGYYVYIILYGFPPFSMSCDELRDLAQKDFTANPDRITVFRNLAYNRDCGLQGHTVVQLMMAWILLSPRLVPTQRMINYVNWIWIFGVYLGATIVSAIFQQVDPVDTIVALVLLSAVNGIAISKKYYIEKGQQSKLVSDLQKHEESKKMFHILEYMVPEHLVSRMLQDPGKVICEPIERVSILFIMFVDFDQTARRLTAEQLLDFLNRYFTLFDRICANNDVTKIETVGEEYVCAVGVVPDDVQEAARYGHQHVLGRLIKVAQELIKLQQRDHEVVLKMGIHTGPIVAGVIGNKLPRFRLFGDTINTAARMMQKGRPGELQFGEETYKDLPSWVPTKVRGNIEMKGKGQVMTYLFDPQRLDQVKEKEKEKDKDAAAAEAKQRPLPRRSLTDQLLEISTAAETPVPEEQSVPSSAQRSSAALLEPPAMPAEVELTSITHSAGSSEQRRKDPITTTPDLEEGPETEAEAAKKREKRNAGSTASQQVSRRSRGMSLRGLDDDESTRKFEEVLKQVGVTEDGTIDGTVTFRTWIRRVGIRLEDFSSEMEAEFVKWFHANSICKKLDARLDKQALALSALTAIELVYAVLVSRRDTLEKHHWYGSNLRLPVYVSCRTVAFGIIFSWRLVAGAKNWVAQSPRQAQNRLLISYLLIALLMFISYDALTVSSHNSQSQGEAIHLRQGSMFSLVFVPAYMVVMTQHPFLFFPSCSFVVLAAWLMLLSKKEWFDYSNMFFSDTGMVVFVGTTMLNAFLSHTAEQSLRARWKARHAVMNTRERVETILNTLMPVKVVEELQRQLPGAAPPSHHYHYATIAQSDLCGFTKLAATRQPQEVVEFIGELFGLFDELTDLYEVYKVETVGDAYIAGQADSPLTEKWKPLQVVLFGLDMVRATHEWSRKRGENVSCRVGVHSGECIGGIVGTEMQRYHLFGELMTIVEVLESTAPEGKVQVSQACKLEVESQLEEEGNQNNKLVMFEKRNEPKLMTSKGEIHEYDEVGGPTFVVRSYAQLRNNAVKV